MAVVLPPKSCFQTSNPWMSTKQSAIASVGLRRIASRNHDGRRWWFIGKAYAGAVAGGRTCLQYSPSRSSPARYISSSSGRPSLPLHLNRDHAASGGPLPRSPIKPVAKMIGRLHKRTSAADWGASQDQDATSSRTEMDEEEPGVEGSSRFATRTIGAVCLIIGTSIGSGILALPQRTSPAGFIPSATTMVICWGFLLVEALLIAEVNVSLLNMNMSKKQLLVKKATSEYESDNYLVNRDQELDTISFRTMAVETLGDLGGSVATITYVFLGYTSLVAYCSKSGELLSQMVSLPPALLGSSFTALTAALICFGGYRVTDGINQCLTAVMIGLLVVIEVTAGALDKGSLGTNMLVPASDDWSKVPPTIPLIIFSLVYHDITPVICSYLNGDLKRIRLCMVVGSLVPLLCLVIWDSVMLGFPAAGESGVPGALDVSISSCFSLVEPFSLLAVGTSMIGTLLGFSSFFEEQIRGSRSKKKLQEEGLDELDHLTPVYGRDNLIGLLAMAAAVVPTLVTSASVADAFDAATDFAGGYCMTILYGVLPPAMAWSLKFKKQEGSRKLYTECEDNKVEDDRRGKLLQAKPTLIGAGLLASGVAVLQVVNDCTNLIPFLGFSN